MGIEGTYAEAGSFEYIFTADDETILTAGTVIRRNNEGYASEYGIAMEKYEKYGTRSAG